MKRILIVRVGAMGDVLHALPAVAALRLALPAAHIGWAIDPRWAPLLRSEAGRLPIVSTLHLVDTRRWTSKNVLSEIANLRRELRAERYDLAIDLQGNIRSALIGRVAGTRSLTGSDTPRERPARLLYTQAVALKEAHVIRQAAELIAAALQIPIVPLRPELPIDPQSEAWAEPFAKSPLILIAPTAGWGAKQWPLARYAALIPRLEAQGYRVVVNAIPASLSNLPAESVPSTLAQLIALTRRAALVVGGDTGPIHLAAALGRPTLALFGPTDPARNGPHFPDSHTHALRHPISRTDHHRTAAPDPGLERITVEQVLEAALALLKPQPGE